MFVTLFDRIADNARMRASVFVSVITLWLTIATGSDVIVNTQYGKVRGRAVLVNNTVEEKTIHEFRGIPFAKNTTGSRRFAKPDAMDSWSPDVLDVTTPGDMCPQNSFGNDISDISEDCLNLDITSPDVNGGPYPVMFWVYGGAYVLGANRQYPGHFLSMFDVVVVCVNYRLGKLGFAYTGNDACPGNAGLWDQRMGLEFVVNNIRNFGGDPSRITVFGESAGSTSSSLLMLSPQTKDMFQQAILESGSATNYWTINSPESDPKKYVYQVAEDLDCLRSTDKEMMECLRNPEWQSFINTSPVLCTEGYFCLGMAPVVDGEGGFLPKTPRELRQSGDIMDGPIIAGVTEDEGWLFAQLLDPFIDDYGLAWNALTKLMVRFCDDRYDKSTLAAARKAIKNHYVSSYFPIGAEKYRTAMSKMLTDAAFGLPWNTEMNDQQSINSSYGFVFNFSHNPGSRVGHAGDVPYVWGYPMLEHNMGLRKHIISRRADSFYTQEDIDYSLFVQRLFTNFAKHGNPTPQPVDDPFGRKTTWTPFDNDSMSTLQFGQYNVDMTQKYREEDYKFWRETIPSILLGEGGSNEAPEKSWECMFAFTDILDWIFPN